MRIPFRQRWLLRDMGRMLRRSDPHLAAMLVMFARLYGDEAIASAEQARRAGVAAALIGARSAVMRLAAGAHRMARHVAIALAGLANLRRRHAVR